MEAGNFEVHLWLNMIQIREENKIQDFSSFALSTRKKHNVQHWVPPGASGGHWRKGGRNLAVGIPCPNENCGCLKLCFYFKKKHKMSMLNKGL